MDVRMFTVGPVQENCFLVRREGADARVLVDPGEEAPSACSARSTSSASSLEAILLTHTHFDHIGAVAPVAQATGAPVYCPQLEVPVLQRHHGLRPGRASGRSSLGGRARPSRAASSCSSRASRSR